MSHELWLRQFDKNIFVMKLLGLNILFLFQLHQTKCVQDDGVSNLKHGCIRNSFMHEAAVLKFFSFFPTDYYLCFCLFDAGGWKLRLINTKVAIWNVMKIKMEVVLVFIDHTQFRLIQDSTGKLTNRNRTICLLGCLIFRKRITNPASMTRHTQPKIQRLQKQKRAHQSLERHRTTASDRHASTLL